MNQFNETICFQTKIVTAEGSPYYLNRVTGETSWDAPPAAPAPTPNLPPGWIVQYTQDGIPYYANTATGETTWEPPKAAPPPVARAPAVAARPMGGPAPGRAQPMTPARPMQAQPMTPARPMQAQPMTPARPMGGGMQPQRMGSAQPMPSQQQMGMGMTPQRPMGGQPMTAARPMQAQPMQPQRMPAQAPMPSRQPAPVPNRATGSMTINERFFHEQLSREDAEARIQGRAIGTFLMRKSSKPSYVCCSYVDLRNDIQHLLIEFAPGKGYRVEAENSDNIFYPTLSALVAGHADMFKMPINR